MSEVGQAEWTKTRTPSCGQNSAYSNRAKPDSNEPQLR